ncbi:hypothetical protein LJC30_02565 [Odoribacter sp. OttesenSCG-928-L07]|nr:hypothetical protein [Odoribacter sp. OttesenSCG-928-L07]MDL2239199.1 hypothetical protein [Bacteroidales bacterium OttesenSCG-928-L14]MDL2240543.1 hypothetical protein [Bacteroidales bacterium OttesenSCG-928-K22]
MSKRESDKKRRKVRIGNFFKTKKIVKYLRELSVVVIGVAITFIGSNLINERQKEKELHKHLEAITTELKENLDIVKEKGKFYNYQAELSRYLMSDKPENLNTQHIDSLNFKEDYSVIGSFFTLVYKTSALEMLTNSGALNRIKDKRLSQSILDSYASLEVVKHESDAYMNRKINEIYNIILDNEQLFFGDILNPKFRRAFYFFMVYIDIDKLFENCATQIEKTLSLLETK